MRIAGQLNIGPLRMWLRAPATQQVRYSAPAYAGFYADGDAALQPEPQQVLPVELKAQALPIPTHEPLWCADQHWAIWEEADSLVCCVGIHERETAMFHCCLPRGASVAQLSIHPDHEAVGPEGFDSPLRYPMDQILSWGMLSRTGGFLLHAAVAVRDGVGWVFAGHSGAGKSTLSELCHAEGFRILNDDRVMLFQRNGAWKVAGTPWHGSGRFAEAAEVPLGGLYFLKQADEERMESITRSQARLELLDVAAVPWFEENWSRGILDALEQLLQDVACCRFHFTPTPAAVQVLNRTQESGVEVCG